MNKFDQIFSLFSLSKTFGERKIILILGVIRIFQKIADTVVRWYVITRIIFDVLVISRFMMHPLEREI